MINMDMVGRLRDNKLIAIGSGDREGSVDGPARTA